MIYLISLVTWAVSVAIGVWYLLTFREMAREIRTIRRYLQEIYDMQKAPHR